MFPSGKVYNDFVQKKGFAWKTSRKILGKTKQTVSLRTRDQVLIAFDFKRTLPNM